MGHVVSDDLEEAISARTERFEDLVWKRKGERFELAVELDIPDERKQLLANKAYNTVRYEIAVGVKDDAAGTSILAEKVLLKVVSKEGSMDEQRTLFPQTYILPDTILTPKGLKHTKTVVSKAHGGNDNYYPETEKGWFPSFKLGDRKSALRSLPEDESRFPVTTWLKNSLSKGIQRLNLNSLLMRKPSPPGRARGFRPDGSSLPWVISDFKKNYKDRYSDWILHLKTILTDLNSIRIVEKQEDRHCYIVLCYSNGLEIPSWMVSDGTLRFMALTLPAYYPELRGIYLIEEPENGIHPRAVEALYQSLSSVYDAQILLATHSPVFLSSAEASNVLCFAKTEDGAVDIVQGSNHPRLRNWKGEVNLGTLFAGGVLG
jgi:hypothetical protein